MTRTPKTDALLAKWKDLYPEGHPDREEWLWWLEHHNDGFEDRRPWLADRGKGVELHNQPYDDDDLGQIPF